MKLKSFLATALLLTVLIHAGLAYVYRFTNEGERQYWAGMPVSYSINRNGSEDISSFSTVENAFNTIFQAWEQVSMAEISFTYQGSTALAQVGNDGTNLLAFDSYTTDFLVSRDAGPTVVGIALSTFYPKSGEIVDADIIFNDAGYNFTTTGETDLGNNLVNLLDVAAHEVGHLLGLDHTFLETGTMWPYAKQGQRYLSEDDMTGVRSLYPDQEFAQRTERFRGAVTDDQGDPLWGIFVSAIREDTGEETVAAITGEDGRYLIEGLAQATGYYLKARSVDLDHLGPYIQEHGTYDAFIPQYYTNATRLEDARAVVSGTVSEGLDFQLKEATILARYDREIQNYTVVSSPYAPVKNDDYLAIRFPASSLPGNFEVFGMTFYNNDGNMVWPRIMLTTGSGDQPDLGNILRLKENYVGKELDLSTVEWEMYQASNARDLWVVFRLISKSNVGVGDGPGIVAETGGEFHRDFFYSINGGNTFQPYPTESYDPVVYLTVGVLETPVLEPQIQLALGELDFGIAKVGVASHLPLPVANLGNAPLQLSGIYSDKPNSFGISATDMTVPAGGVDTLLVSFTPGGTIQYTGMISMATNDPAMGTVNLPVKGTGARPAASVALTSLDLGELELNITAVYGVAVRNTGPVPLLVSQVTAGPEPFSVSPTGVEVAAGDSTVLEVVFSPSAEGNFSGSLTFTTDDPDHTQFTISLTGVGKAGEQQVVCDFNGDGKKLINDVIAYLLYAREHPEDLARLDWNGDGRYAINDAIMFLINLIQGTCPDALVQLAGVTDEIQAVKMEGLTQEDIEYIEEMMPLMDLTEEQEAAFRVALYGQAGMAALPRAVTLAQNYPNPFNPATVIGFTVPRDGAVRRVSIKVYDIRGALVRVLVDGIKEPGSHTVYWDGTDKNGRRVSSGIYLCRLKTDGAVFTRKMVVVN